MVSENLTECVKNMRSRTVRLDREGDYWTKEERDELVRLFYEGVGITSIALILQRTESAIIQQIEAMDLFGRRKGKNTPSKQPRCLCSSCKLHPALCSSKEACTASQEGL